MQRYESIEKGIANKDVRKLRAAIANICYTSRDFSSNEFDEAVQYVKANGINIMDKEVKGSLISEGKTTYSEDDFADAVFLLKENFCKERIADVKKIGRAVYGKKKPSSLPRYTPGNRPNPSSHRKTSSRQPQSDLNWLPVAIGTIAVIGIIILIINLLK